MSQRPALETEQNSVSIKFKKKKLATAKIGWHEYFQGKYIQTHFRDAVVHIYTKQDRLLIDKQVRWTDVEDR